MKAAVVALAALVLVSGWHVTLWLGWYPVAVPVPVLVLLAELAVCGALGYLIGRAAGFRPWWLCPGRAA